MTRHTDAPESLSRRRFLKAAASTVFILGFYVPLGRRTASAQTPPSETPAPNLFLKIDSDNIITVISKYFEMGQGVVTGVATLLAEELEADWSKLRFEFAPNDVATYNNLVFGPVMVTGGSASMAGSWMQMRKVGAAARTMMIEAAAKKWKVPEAELRAENSTVVHTSGKSATYAELAADAMQLPVPQDAPLKDPADWKLIGKNVPRLDSAEKTDGKALFAMDVKRPGMLTAAIAHPPLFGAKVKSFDATASEAIPGVEEVVQIPAGVAVLAKDSWSALRGRDALKVEWDTSGAETRSDEQIFAEYRQQAQGEGLVATKRGDAGKALPSAAQKLTAEFTFPFLAHTPMEPLNCILDFDGDKAEMWSGCQLQSIDEHVLSEVLGIESKRIRIHTLLGGGSFGRRGNPLGDWVAELAQIGKAMKSRAPVHLLWSREDDIRGGYYRPIVLHQLEAGLDDSGNIAGWQHKVVTQSLFTGTPFAALMVKDGVDHSSVEGLADTPYQIDNFNVRVYNAESPVPVLWWRSVGHTHTAHVMETVIDELARMAGRDPLQYRLELLPEARDREVLQLVAGKSGWGGSTGENRGRGIAFHKSFGTRVAMVADVSIDEGDFTVDKITAAVDCGVAINPDVVTAQIEGAIGFALSTLLRNRITLKDGRVQQSNFHNYEPTRIREMPAVEVHIVQSAEPPSGIGEPGVPPLAPAVGNAIAAATGKRMYAMPFSLKA
ncbi:xanthine dehydrogenase family protein molybdopterin-binding subunit [Microbulbifer taiwanensis]|uniref:Molybdopterin cofactor-binding domain-containing protein n=1 Tax=Microbulbifer taiwanensis TaxID=986746 RepID=A0ABW1YUV4_9GAMM|nr:xanthine dehydrogenase family protein molybdopterin-binding subunit [Microbulbifer taiwanensis]